MLLLGVLVEKAESVLLRMSAGWTVVGLVSGLVYRELTRAHEFEGFTQLAVVHTHTLVLGTVVGLLLLALQRTVGLGEDRRFWWLVGSWNVGLVLTAGTMTVKGTLQVLRSAAAESPALAGVSGLGHVLLSVGFVFLFLVLSRRVRDARPGITSAASDLDADLDADATIADPAATGAAAGRSQS